MGVHQMKEITRKTLLASGILINCISVYPYASAIDELIVRTQKIPIVAFKDLFRGEDRKLLVKVAEASFGLGFGCSLSAFAAKAKRK